METNDKVKNYVDGYVKSREGGRCRPPITVEIALTHKLVQDQISYYLNHKDESDSGLYSDKHDYN